MTSADEKRLVFIDGTGNEKRKKKHERPFRKTAEREILGSTWSSTARATARNNILVLYGRSNNKNNSKEQQ